MDICKFSELIKDFIFDGKKFIFDLHVFFFLLATHFQVKRLDKCLTISLGQ